MSSIYNHPIHAISYLNEIPYDVKDVILSFIEEPHHLLALALTSKEWSRLIIPNHLDYRILRIRWPGRPNIWPHMALRADLTKNMRVMRFTSPQDNSPQIFPRTLRADDGTAVSLPFGPLLVRAMNTAFLNFKRLKSFTWNGFRAHSLYTGPIFDALNQCVDLEELHMIQMLSPTEPIRLDTSILRLSNLKKLTLYGKIWDNFGDAIEEIEHFINRSPDLRELTVSYGPSSTLFTSCPLRCLTKLHIYAEPAAGLNSLAADTIFLNFINSHPTIEDLLWVPRDESMEIPRGFLPNLRRLYTKDRIAKAIIRDTSVAETRHLEALSQISLGPNTLALLRRINRTHLEELHLWRFVDLEQIVELSTLFPNLKVLDVPNIADTGRAAMDDVINTLAHFPNLERYLDSSLWLAIHPLEPGLKKETINKLGHACPKLRILKHWKNALATPWEIELVREPGGEVKWREWIVPEDLA